MRYFLFACIAAAVAFPLLSFVLRWLLPWFALALCLAMVVVCWFIFAKWTSKRADS